jgi:hypothetical protein
MECSPLKNWNVSSVAVVVQIPRVDPLLLAKEMTRRVPIVVAVDSTGLIATAMESSTRKKWKVCRKTSGAVSIAMGMASSRRKSWKASVVAVAMIVVAEAEVAVAAARISDRSRVVVRAISPVVAEVMEVAEIHRRCVHLPVYDDRCDQAVDTSREGSWRRKRERSRVWSGGTGQSCSDVM